MFSLAAPRVGKRSDIDWFRTFLGVATFHVEAALVRLLQTANVEQDVGGRWLNSNKFSARPETADMIPGIGLTAIPFDGMEVAPASYRRLPNIWCKKFRKVFLKDRLEACHTLR